MLHVLPYTPENLAVALCNKLRPEAEVKKSFHYAFFCEYFHDNSIAAHTIVIEEKYISKSFMQDYSNFYATCFNDYSRHCRRVHFFSEDFNIDRFNAALVEPGSDNTIWDSYIGYTVVNPLPKTSIGTTILKTYCHDAANKRHFPCTREYNINLFGKQLTLKSLAFQEQDRVVGACASTALWSAFNKTSEMFQTPLPSPSIITKSARNAYNTSGRTYQNASMTYYQIGNAIESVGLEFELRNRKDIVENFALAKALIYAYNKMGLPVLLSIDVPGVGEHLIVITGYKESNKITFNTDGITLKASAMERFYAHDDQIGPFSRLQFEEREIITSWLDRKRNEKKKASLSSIFIPIHNKVRLTFEDVLSKVKYMDRYFDEHLGTDYALYWDIYLDYSNRYKHEVLDSSEFPPDAKYEIVTRCFPKYVWLAKGYLQTGNGSSACCIIELVFDATEIAAADSCICLQIFNEDLWKYWQENLLKEEVKQYFINNLGENYFHLMLRAADLLAEAEPPVPPQAGAQTSG